MAYNDFQDAKPVASDNGLVVIDDIRENLMAMRDAVVMGAMSGWAYSTSGGTNEEPAQVLYTKSTEILRGTLTWGSSGGADGNVTQAVWAYSANSGSTYDTIGTESISYNTDGTVSSTSWA